MEIIQLFYLSLGINDLFLYFDSEDFLRYIFGETYSDEKERFGMCRMCLFFSEWEKQCEFVYK